MKVKFKDKAKTLNPSMISGFKMVERLDFKDRKTAEYYLTSRYGSSILSEISFLKENELD